MARSSPEPRLAIPTRLDPRAFLARDPTARVHRLAGRTMGTCWSVRLAAPAPPPATVGAAIAAVLDEVVAEMSGWEAASRLARFNRAAAGSWHVLPSGFFHVLAAGVGIARATGGAFDPAIGAMVDLWGFGPGPARLEPPAEAEIAAARARSGWERLELDAPARRARQPGGLALDLSGIAKGHAVDRVAALLAARGFGHVLVEIGGELKGLGVRPDGQPWWVAVEAPPGIALPETRVALHGLAIATSGDYRRFFDHGGRRYAHSLDPRIGRPVANDLASVTVVHEECLRADAFATALLVMGREEGPAFATTHDLAALFVRRDGREIVSPAFGAMTG